MTADPAAALRDRQAEGLRRLRERFKATIANTLDALRQLGAQLAERADAPEVLDALRRELHRVHGTAGSYGYTEASRLAGEAEARAVAWSGDPLLELEVRAVTVRRLVSALDEAFRAEPGSEERGETLPILMLIGTPPALSTRLREAAGRHGYTTRVLSAAQAQPAIIRDIGPVAVAAMVGESRAVAVVARDLGLPLVVLEDRPRTQQGGAPPVIESGGTLVDVHDACDAVFEVVDRARARIATRGVTILALDDDPAILAIVTYVLEEPGIQVRTINDSAFLEAELDRHLPSLLVSDINMPGASGIELTRRLRATPRYADLPILLLSSETDATSRQEALEAGADEFVSKPIAAAELRHRVNDRLARHRLGRIAAGLHPVSALPTGPEATRLASAAFGRMRDNGVPCTVAVLRPAEGDPSGDETPAWLQEMARVAHAIAGDGMAAHHDGTALLLVLSGDGTRLAERLTGLASGSEPGVPHWRVGMVERTDLQRAEFAVALRSAEDAVDAARLGATEVVHRWRRDDGLIAPDVIVVEDDPALSEMLQYALRANGFTYRAFANGRVALDFLLAARTQGRRPIVLLDVDLPGLDGYSLHERLAVERAGDYSVVFVTIHGAESDQLRALMGGAVDFILKPLNLRILMAKLSSWAAAGRYGTTRT